jgi:hypothetical protein
MPPQCVEGARRVVGAGPGTAVDFFLGMLPAPVISARCDTCQGRLCSTRMQQLLAVTVIALSTGDAWLQYQSSTCMVTLDHTPVALLPI